jgi:hypothetical protein
MAIDFKAKKLVANGLKLRFVRFSGHALTQGVVNMKIDGVPVRIYSAAKTVADCLKYRRKMGSDLAARILQKSLADRKCSEQRLRHFAKICRVYKIVHAAYFSARNAEPPPARLALGRTLEEILNLVRKPSLEYLLFPPQDFCSLS